MKLVTKALSFILSISVLIGLSLPAGAVRSTVAPVSVGYEAIELLHSLNIVGSDTSDKFEPTVLLTRAQVAKMIYVIIKGGADDKGIDYTGVSNTFTDTFGHWAEGYINYSFASGYISGNGNGTFNPDKKMTGFEFLKVVLAVIGYDTKKEGFEGKNWDQRVSQRAVESGILMSYVGSPDQPISLGDAAAIIYSMLYTKAVEYTSADAIKQTEETVGESMFGLRIIKGLLLANDIAGLGMSPLSESNKTWIDANENGQQDEQEILPVTTDTGLIGYYVTAVINVKDSTINKVYDIYKTTGRNFDVSVTADTAEQLKDEEVSYYINFMPDADLDKDDQMDGLSSAAVTTYIDNNGNGKYDLVLSWNCTYAQITKINIRSEKQAVDFEITGSNIVLSTESYTGLVNITVGDRILYFEGNASTKKGIVKKIIPIEGTMTNFDAENVLFMNVSYRFSNIPGIIETHPGINIMDDNLGKSALLYVYKRDVLEISPIIPQGGEITYAYIFQIKMKDTKNKWFKNITDRSYTCRAVLEDGSDGEYKIAKVDGILLSASSQIDATPQQGLYSCQVNSFGQLELTTVFSTAR